MKGSFSSPVPFYPLPPSKGNYHYTPYSRTVKENQGKTVTSQLWVGLGCFDAGGSCLFKAAGLTVPREEIRVRSETAVIGIGVRIRLIPGGVGPLPHPLLPFVVVLFKDDQLLGYFHDFCAVH